MANRNSRKLNPQLSPIKHAAIALRPEIRYDVHAGNKSTKRGTTVWKSEIRSRPCAFARA